MDTGEDVGTVTTTGIHGDRHTYLVRLRIDHDGPHTIWTYDAQAPGEQDFFQARFLIVNDTVIQQIMMIANTKAYRQVGLPEAMIEFAAAHTGRTVESSTNTGTKRQDEESRNEPATKAWKRLEEAGRASFDRERDRFLLRPGSGARPCSSGLPSAGPSSSSGLATQPGNRNESK